MDVQLMIPARSAQHGFTLIELMIVVALLAIISAFALPAFQSFIASNRLTSEANELLAGLNLARSEAVRTQRHVVLCRTNGVVEVDPSDPNCPMKIEGCVETSAGSWLGWAVFVDSDSDGVYARSECVLRTHVLPGGPLNVVSNDDLGSAGNRIKFRPDGLARAQDSMALQTAGISVCDSSGSLSTAANTRNVNLTSGSRMAVTRGGNASCGVTAAVEAPTEEAEGGT